MTDHPSNPPSQEPPADEYCLRAQVISYNCKHTGRGEMGCISCFAREFQRLDSALAAQEARHKAEMEEMREARDSWAGIAGRNAGALAEAESKLREAREREKTLVDAARHVLSLLRREARLRLGPGELAEARGALLVAIRSGPAQQAAEECAECRRVAGHSTETHRACRDSKGKCFCGQHGADPPEQETPKPEPSMRHARSAANPDYPYERVCVGCGEDWPCASAPPAHGGGE